MEVIRIGFTGHRPKSTFMGGYDLNSPRNQEIGRMIFDAIVQIMKDKSTEETKLFEIYTGGALGFDQKAFDVSFDIFQNTNFGKLILCLPWDGHHLSWYGDDDVRRHEKHKYIANEVVYVSDAKGELSFSQVRKLLDDRNKYIVDNCDVLVAGYDRVNNPGGGTKNCIEYAISKGKEIYYI